MADGTIFERKGLQTAAILTDTFRRPGDAMARVVGIEPLVYGMAPAIVGTLLNYGELVDVATATR